MTVRQAFKLAQQHHRFGRLAEAEAIYRQILTEDPRHADSLHMLGTIAGQTGRNDIAVDFISQSIVLKPHLAEAHNDLGNALYENGKLDGAISAYRQGIALKPNFPEACSNLGRALRKKGQLDEAIAAYRQAIILRPKYPEAYSNLGNALRDQDQLDEAITAYRQAIELNPLLAEAHCNLATALTENGQLDEAILAYRQAIELNPLLAEAYCNLGNALRGKGHLNEATAAFRQAIGLKPNFPEAHCNLGCALQDQGQLDEAITAYRQAVRLRPNDPEVYSNLGNALSDKGQLDEAISNYRQAIILRPRYPELHSNLGNALKDQGLLDEAIAAYRHAITLKPNFPEACSNLLLALNYHPSIDADSLAEEHLRWNRQLAEPLRQFIQPHRNDCSPERRLRIGYVSPDFREHPVGRFLLPLLAQHDRRNFEIFCYSAVPAPDDLTRQLRTQADQWYSLVGLTDQQAAELIRQNQIDILVDLALHTAHNRLLIFARKPAPVQVTYLAYAGSSGLSTMDCRLSDPYLDPPGVNESAYSEQTIRLPHSFWCYDPPECGDIVTTSLPANTNNFITFGCLNDFRKVSEPTLETWARLLQAVPEAQLLLHAVEGTHRQRTADLLKKFGGDPRRLRFVGWVPLSRYLQLHQRFDIALDPFPFGGGATTCDALWMGVPVVSLAGKTAVGRGGLSILSNIGLPELVANTNEDYVKIATNLANDLPRLAHLRNTLRARMEQSPLMDAPRFARSIESAYREMWRKWCAKQG